MANIQRLTATDLVRAINLLTRNQRYHYVNPRTPTQIAIEDVRLPEGPIIIRRWSPSRGTGIAAARPTPISTEMLARVANAFTPYRPVNFDLILAASYNTRSALETLLAHTPEFYTCYPGRVDSYSGKVVRGHKHLMWCPDTPHRSGEIHQMDTDGVISEVTLESYDVLQVPENLLSGEIDIEVARQHVRIQIALILIGEQLGFRTWVALNDRGIVYNDRTLAEMPSVVKSLQSEPLFAGFADAAHAARLIDCIWFKNRRFMPAVMEVEHTTGVVDGLTRMQGLYETMPPIETRYVIVAADELRQSVVEKANRPQFRNLKTRFLPYSAVVELYHLFSRRKPKGVSQEFLDAYMESVVE